MRAQFALFVTKSGLKDLVCNTLQARYQKIMNDVRKQVNNNFRCASCTTRTIVYGNLRCPTRKQQRKCPNGVCDLVRDKFIKSHKHRNPSWRNTHAEYWDTLYWEYAKCFMPPGGYSDKASYLDTDLNGILSILLTQEDFVHEVDESICSKVRNYF